MSEKNPPTSSASLNRPVTTLLGVGPERAALLEALEIKTVGDLLLYRPRRYEDRQTAVKIADLALLQPAITHGTIVAMAENCGKTHISLLYRKHGHKP